MVYVDVKQYRTVLRHWSQFVPNMSTDIKGHEALHWSSSSSSSSIIIFRHSDPRTRGDTDSTRNRPSTMSSFTSSPVQSLNAISSPAVLQFFQVLHWLKSFQGQLGRSLHNLQPVPRLHEHQDHTYIVLAWDGVSHYGVNNTRGTDCDQWPCLNTYRCWTCSSLTEPSPWQEEWEEAISEFLVFLSSCLLAQIGCCCHLGVAFSLFLLFCWVGLCVCGGGSAVVVELVNNVKISLMCFVQTVLD